MAQRLVYTMESRRECWINSGGMNYHQRDDSQEHSIQRTIKTHIQLQPPRSFQALTHERAVICWYPLKSTERRSFKRLLGCEHLHKCRYFCDGELCKIHIGFLKSPPLGQAISTDGLFFAISSPDAQHSSTAPLLQVQVLQKPLASMLTQARLP